MTDSDSSATPNLSLVRNALRLCTLMHDWPTEALDELAAASHLGRYAARQEILAHDFQRRDIFVIASGAVGVESLDADGARFLLTVHGPSDSVGWIRLLEATSFSFHYLAMEPTVLVHIPAVVAVKVFDRYPELWKALCLSTLRRAHMSVLIHRQRTLSTLTQRLVQVIIRLAQAQHPGAGQAAGPLRVQVSQSDLAAMLSVSRQTTNKELKKLQKQGLLQVEYGHLSIPDLRRLELGS